MTKNKPNTIRQTAGNFPKAFFQLLLIGILFVLQAMLPEARGQDSSYPGQYLDFDENKLEIVITPDFFPIIWRHAQKYGIDYEDTTGVVDCTFQQTTYGSNYIIIHLCPSEATSAGAVYFRQFSVPGYGTVTVYYNSALEAIGSGADLDGDNIGDSQDNDIDGDGVPNGSDQYPRDPARWDDYVHDSDSDTVVDAEDGFPYDPKQWSRVAGSLPGQFNVSPSGAAMYTVPVHVPPGTAGMQPSLNLVYNSQGGNGLLGLGWSLSGLSAITRCPSTLAQDGETKGVSYNNNDRFCLDGQRLMLVSGAYGAAGSVYRTEIDQFSRIVAQGNAGSGPASFQVQARSGEILEYGILDYPVRAGGNADSQIKVFGLNEVRVWALGRVRDRAGNYYTISYEEDAANGEYRPTQIDYTGNTSAGLSLYRSIYFDYEDRFDIRTSYHAGLPTRLSKRLVGIRTDAGRYKLKYAPHTIGSRSKLVSIQQCDSGDICMGATLFEWKAPGNGGWQPADKFKPLHEIVDAEVGRERGIRFVDLDGDGLPDMIRSRESENPNDGGGYQTWMNQGPLNGWWESTWYSPPIIPSTGKEVPFVDRDNSEDRGSRFVDLNGDGLLDWVYAREGHGNHAWRNIGYGWEYWPTFAPPYPIVDNANGYDRGARFVDLNNDGLVDFIKSQELEVQETWKNTGNGWEYWPQYNPPYIQGTSRRVGISDQQTGKDRGSRFIDLNGDGLTDWLYSRENDIPQAWINNGNGWTPAPDFTPPAEFSDQSHGRDVGARLVDLNNDGLADFIKSKENAVQQTWKNTGKRWEYWPEYDPPIVPGTTAKAPISDYNYGEDRGARFMDVNGDGLVDWLYSREGHGQHAWLNTGHGWQINASYSPPAAFVDNANGRDRGVRFTDLDGDGFIDIVRGRENHGFQAWLNKGNVELLEKIKTPLGLVTSISYNPLSEENKDSGGSAYPNPQITPSGYVTSEVRTSDGVDGEFSTRYSYAGLRYNLRGRGSLGFSQISVTDNQTNVTTTTNYHQVFPLSGAVKSITEKLTTNGRPLLSETIYTLSSMPTSNKSVFVYASKVDQTTYHLNDEFEQVGSTNTVTEETYLPNASGFPKSYGFPDTVKITTTGLGTYEKFAENQYQPVNETQWLLGLLTGVTTTTTTIADQQTADNSQRTSAFEYDANGLLKKKIDEPGLAEPLKLVTAYSHDSYGNVIRQTACATDFENCGVPGETGPAHLPFRISHTQYDARGQFPESLTNGLGETETFVYEDRFGNIKSQTGPNLLTTLWEYDGFGRVIHESRADGSKINTRYDMCYTCIDYSRYKVTKTGTGMPTVINYYDDLERPLRTTTQGFKGTAIHVDTHYNEDGLPDEVTEPYFAGGTVHTTITIYDTLNREQTIIPADGSPTIEIDYDGFTTHRKRTVNGSQRIKSETKNGVGQTLKIVDEGGNITKYTYDRQSNLTETTINDLPSTTIEVKHDIRGRKTLMIDPDMGAWSYQYNGFGDLISQTDALSQTITMKYDVLGRMVERTEPEGVSIWEYGNNTTFSSGNRNIGKLIKVSGPAAGQGEPLYIRDIGYDDKGRQASATMTLAIPAITNRSYTTNWTYYGPTETHAGKLKSVVYPQVNGSSFRVDRLYNSYGYLNKVQSASGSTVYWQASDMNARGQLSQATLGNGVTTTWAYRDESGWLDGMMATNTSGELVHHMAYGFDEIGNLQWRKDWRQNLTEHFEYDEDGYHFDRLTRAYVVNSGGTITADKRVKYDNLGNITFKTGIGYYKYGSDCATGSGPHAVCEIRSTATGGTLLQSYQYNANGNMISRTGESVLYTSFNKPYQFQQNGSSVANFYYGPEHSRVFKLAGTKTTAYIGLGGTGNPLYEHEKDGGVERHTHYIYAAGAQSVAAHIVEVSGGTSSRTEYFHRDHLGSLEAISDSTGALANVQYMSYDAWGQRRNADWTDASGALPGVTGNIGFTGHESIPEVNLIHMNGRVYDPALGRFLSADPKIQLVKESQTYNRYSYVLNNPVRYTDPTGYTSEKIAKIVGTIKVIVGTILVGISGEDYDSSDPNQEGNNLLAQIGINLIQSGMNDLNGKSSNDGLRFNYTFQFGGDPARDYQGSSSSGSVGGGIKPVAYQQTNINSFESNNLTDSGTATSPAVEAMSQRTESAVIDNGVQEAERAPAEQEVQQMLVFEPEDNQGCGVNMSCIGRVAELNAALDEAHSVGLNDCADTVLLVGSRLNVPWFHGEEPETVYADALLRWAAENGRAVTLAEAQSLANAGEFVMGGLTSQQLKDTNGHVLTVTPGQMQRSGNFGNITVPMVMNSSRNGNNFRSMHMGHAFGEGTPTPSFYHITR